MDGALYHYTAFVQRFHNGNKRLLQPERTKIDRKIGMAWKIYKFM
jgi:hypothetical protein